MPLLANKTYILNKVKKDKKENEGELFHPLTNEICENVQELERKSFLYNQNIWTCKITGQINLTFKDAQKSEQGCARMIKNSFMKCFEPVALQHVHHSRENLDNIIQKSWAQIHEEFCVNEPVTIKLTAPKQLLLKGVVMKIDKTPHINETEISQQNKINTDASGSDKENVKKRAIPAKKSYHYSVKLFELDKLVNDIPAETIERTLRPPSKDQIRMFIRAHATRHSGKSTNPWVVDDELVKKYKLPNMEPQFTCDKAMIKEMSRITELQVYGKLTGQEVMVVQKNSNSKCSNVALATKPNNGDVTVDLTLSDEEEEEQGQEKRVEAVVKSKKMSIKSILMDASARQLPPLAQQLLRLMKENSQDQMVNQLLTRCSQYTDEMIDTFPDLIRMPIKDKKEKMELKNRLNAMSHEEREAYMAERRHELRQQQRDRRRLEERRADDAEMAHVNVVLDGALVTMPHSAMTHDQWARLVSLAEFAHCYRGLLGSMTNGGTLSSDEVCRATVGERDDEREMFADLVCVLVRPLMRVARAKETRVLGVSVTEVPVNVRTVGELIKLTILDNDENSELVNMASGADINQLSLADKIALLEMLQARLFELDATGEYIDECQRDSAEAYKRRQIEIKDLNDRWREVRASMTEMYKEIGSEPNADVMASCAVVSSEDNTENATNSMTRRQSIDARNKETEQREKRGELERQYQSLVQDESRVRQQIEKAHGVYFTAINDAKSLMRVHSLGTDRHYRQYWHFKTAPGYVYVEQDNGESVASEWRMFFTEEQLHRLIASLDERGERELALRKEIQNILPTLSEEMKVLAREACRPRVSDAPADESESFLIRGFKEELRETEVNIRQGSLGGVNDIDEWEACLTRGSTLDEMKAALVTVFNGVHLRFWNVPMKSESKRGEYLAEVASATTTGRLCLLQSLLDVCVCWSKSANDNKCRVCHKSTKENELLLCDGCNVAYHMFCLRPALEAVPEGEWLCPGCVMEEGGQQVGAEEDEVVEEEENLCCVCSASGESALGQCVSCHSFYHAHCHTPALRAVPKSGWRCADCRKKEEDKINKRTIARTVSVRKTKEESSNEDKEDKNKLGRSGSKRKTKDESSNEDKEEKKKLGRSGSKRKTKEESSNEDKEDKKKLGRSGSKRKTKEESSNEDKEEKNPRIERTRSTRRNVEPVVRASRKRGSTMIDDNTRNTKRHKNGDNDDGESSDLSKERDTSATTKKTML